MKVRVLLVDDEKEFVDTLAERLEIRDFDVTTTYSGESALELLAEKDVDVVVLDVKMPGKDGVETLKEIKNRKPLTRVIMLTGHATVETAISGMKLGADDYLMKPTETEELVEKINKFHKEKTDHEARIKEAEIKGLIKRKGW